jgi:hypothetical protein
VAYRGGVRRLHFSTKAAAQKVARYKHAQLSAVRLAGDISGKMDDLSLRATGHDQAGVGQARPLIDLEAIQVPQGSRTEVA